MTADNCTCAGGRCQRGYRTVMCGSAANNRGISTLLDTIVDYLPAPNEHGNYSVNPKTDGTVKEPVPRPNHSLPWYLRQWLTPLSENFPYLSIIRRIDYRR